MNISKSPGEINRVRRNTAPKILRRIDAQIERNIHFFSAQSKDAISRRILDLRDEWSMERWLEANAATIGLTTVVLALTHNRKWALATVGAFGMFLLHSLQGFDPPIPILRRLGVRTRDEIDRELYALKALRGDFASVTGDGRNETAERQAEFALAAVTRN
jgi:hypothetical protein